MGRHIDKIIKILIIFGILCVLTIWGLIKLFTEDVIKSKSIINPEIRITVKDNISDTIYFYKQP